MCTALQDRASSRLTIDDDANPRKNKKHLRNYPVVWHRGITIALKYRNTPLKGQLLINPILAFNGLKLQL